MQSAGRMLGLKTSDPSIFQRFEAQSWLRINPPRHGWGTSWPCCGVRAPGAKQTFPPLSLLPWLGGTHPRPRSPPGAHPKPPRRVGGTLEGCSCPLHPLPTPWGREKNPHHPRGGDETVAGPGGRMRGPGIG